MSEQPSACTMLEEMFRGEVQFSLTHNPRDASPDLFNVRIMFPLWEGRFEYSTTSKYSLADAITEAYNKWKEKTNG